MKLFNTTVSTDVAIQKATTSLAGDIKDLSAQRDDALSTFRATAVRLSTINEGLAVKKGNLNELAAFIQEQSMAADKMISDNEAVRSRILEIIGE